MAVNIHITIIELNALHTKRQNLFQELDAVIHLLMEAKHWGLRKSRNATSLNSRFKSLDTDRKSGSAGMPRPISYAVLCLKKKPTTTLTPILFTRPPHPPHLHSFPTRRSSDLHTYHHYRTQRPAYEKTESLPRA